MKETLLALRKFELYSSNSEERLELEKLLKCSPEEVGWWRGEERWKITVPVENYK